MSELVLFTRPGCHLCDEAAALVKRAGYEAHKVDISMDVRLLRDYGTRIPVLRREDTGAELDWPFDEGKLREFSKSD